MLTKEQYKSAFQERLLALAGASLDESSSYDQYATSASAGTKDFPVSDIARKAITEYLVYRYNAR